MFENALRALGRGIVALLQVLVWEPLVEITRGISRGVSDALRRAMPLVMGVLVVFGLLVYAPEAAQLLLVLAIMLFGLKYMVRSLSPAPASKKKKK